MPLTLIPLTLHDHTDLLQAVYEATPGYWRMFGLDAAPEYQAIHTLRAANDTPGRAVFGILHPGEGLGDRGLGTRDQGLGGYAATDAPTTDPPTTDLPTHGRTDAPPSSPTPNPSTLTPVMIGVIDIHMHAPERGVTTVGMVMIAEPWQRQGHALSAWALVEAWLAGSAGMTKVRAGVEAFNMGALRYFEKVGFALTGEATRVPVEEHLVRVLFAEKSLTNESDFLRSQT